MQLVLWILVIVGTTLGGPPAHAQTYNTEQSLRTLCKEFFGLTTRIEEKFPEISELSDVEYLKIASREFRTNKNITFREMSEQDQILNNASKRISLVDEMEPVFPNTVQKFRTYWTNKRSPLWGRTYESKTQLETILNYPYPYLDKWGAFGSPRLADALYGIFREGKKTPVGAVRITSFDKGKVQGEIPSDPGMYYFVDVLFEVFTFPEYVSELNDFAITKVDSFIRVGSGNFMMNNEFFNLPKAD